MKNWEQHILIHATCIMIRLSRVPLEIVQIVFWFSSLFSRIGHKVGDFDYNVSEHGQTLNYLLEGSYQVLFLCEINRRSGPPLLRSVIIRPPSYKAAEDKRLGKNIENAHLLNREIIILDDFNIDFLCAKKVQRHSLVKPTCAQNSQARVKNLSWPHLVSSSGAASQGKRYVLWDIWSLPSYCHKEIHKMPKDQ